MTSYNPNFVDSLLSVGQETIPRQLASPNSAVTMSTTFMRTAFFTARNTETTTRVGLIRTTAAAGGSTGVTAVYVALYTVDATGR